MTQKPAGAPSTPSQLSAFEVVRESPLNILDSRFGGDETNQTDNGVAWTALNAYIGDTYGAEIIVPPGKYRHDTIPVFTRPGLTIRGIGRPELSVEKLTVQADRFKAENLYFTERPGTVAGNGKAIYVDPDGAGRDLTGVSISNCEFNDFFYAVDFRGGTYKIKRIRMEHCFSDRVSTGNAGHFNFFNVQDVTTVGLGSYGGQNSASQNFGNGSGAITVIGGADSDNDVSGGALNFENFFASAKVTVVGGSWGWNIPSGTDAYALTVDDVEDVTVVGADFGGYVRVQTSSGVVRRARFADCQMTRFRALGSGSPQYIDFLAVNDCLLRGVPGVVGSLSAFNIDGNYVRKCRLNGNTVVRFQADGTSENWANSVSVARAANLDMEIDRNDLGGRPVTASSTGGVIRFGQDNVNFGSLTSVTKAPAQTPVKAGIPADADYDIPLLSGQGPVVDSSNNRVYFRVGSTWKFAALT